MAKELVENHISLSIFGLNKGKVFDMGGTLEIMAIKPLTPQSYYEGQRGAELIDAFFLKVSSGRATVILLNGRRQDLGLSSTRCHIGSGRRYWFLCRCGGRFGKLYWGGEGFRCRVCYDLVYRSSQRRKRNWDAELDKMEKKLGI